MVFMQALVSVWSCSPVLLSFDAAGTKAILLRLVSTPQLTPFSDSCVYASRCPTCSADMTYSCLE